MSEPIIFQAEHALCGAPCECCFLYLSLYQGEQALAWERLDFWHPNRTEDVLTSLRSEWPAIDQIGFDKTDFSELSAKSDCSICS